MNLVKSKRQKLLSPAVRWTALGCVALWLLAVGHCMVECSTDGCQSQSGAVPSALTANPAGHHSNQPAHHDDGFCDSLHSVCPISPAMDLIKPNFGLALLNFVSPVQTVDSAMPEAPISRHPPDREPVLTPGLSLGPALHSLAPPVLA